MDFVLNKATDKFNCECLLDIASLRFQFDELYNSVEILLDNDEVFSGTEIYKDLEGLQIVIQKAMEALRHVHPSQVAPKPDLTELYISSKSPNCTVKIPDQPSPNRCQTRRSCSPKVPEIVVQGSDSDEECQNMGFSVSSRSKRK